MWQLRVGLCAAVATAEKVAPTVVSVQETDKDLFAEITLVITGALGAVTVAEATPAKTGKDPSNAAEANTDRFIRFFITCFSL